MLLTKDFHDNINIDEVWKATKVPQPRIMTSNIGRARTRLTLSTATRLFLILTLLLLLAIQSCHGLSQHESERSLFLDTQPKKNGSDSSVSNVTNDTSTYRVSSTSTASLSVATKTTATAATQQSGASSGAAAAAPASLSICPPPLVANPFMGSPSQPRNCEGPCCLPCPVVNSFYQAGLIDRIFYTLACIRIVSFVLSVFVVLSYGLLPQRREHTNKIVLWFSFSQMLWLGTTFFYFGHQRDTQCHDEIVQATMNNDFLCGIQGISIVYFSHAMSYWGSLLVINLHLNVVWRSNFIERYYRIIHVICWGLPLILSVLPAVKAQIEYPGFGSVCLLSNESSNQYFFYPLGFFIFPMFLVHIITFIMITRVSLQFARLDENERNKLDITTASSTTTGMGILRRRRQMLRVFLVQWRAGLMALIYTLIYICYWLFYFIEARKLVNINATTPWFQDWVLCLFKYSTSGNGQNICSDTISSEFVPNIEFMKTAETLTATAGVWLFLIFGTKRQLWLEWVEAYSYWKAWCKGELWEHGSGSAGEANSLRSYNFIRNIKRRVREFGTRNIIVNQPDGQASVLPRGRERSRAWSGFVPVPIPGQDPSELPTFSLPSAANMAENLEENRKESRLESDQAAGTSACHALARIRPSPSQEEIEYHELHTPELSAETLNNNNITAEAKEGDPSSPPLPTRLYRSVTVLSSLSFSSRRRTKEVQPPTPRSPDVPFSGFCDSPIKEISSPIQGPFPGPLPPPPVHRKTFSERIFRRPSGSSSRRALSPPSSPTPPEMTELQPPPNNELLKAVTQLAARHFRPPPILRDEEFPEEEEVDWFRWDVDRDDLGYPHY